MRAGVVHKAIDHNLGVVLAKARTHNPACILLR
jgi:hypothetical protein